MSLKKDITYCLEHDDWEEELKLTEIGNGATSHVYKAESKHLGTIAIKAIKKGPDLDPDDLRREIGILEKYKHENIINYHFSRDNEEHVLLFMEYAEHGDLYNFIRSNPNISWFDRYKIALGISKGLKCLHDNNIIHRDLKGLNVLLDKDNIPKIADFGTSKRIDSNSKLISVVCGTYGWFAPETFYTDRTLESDIYSLGVVFWEISSGEIPFSNLDVAFIKKKVLKNERPPIPEDCPSNFSELITMCWNQNPLERPKIDVVISILNSMIDQYTNHNPDNEELNRCSVINSDDQVVDHKTEDKSNVEVISKIEDESNVEVISKTERNEESNGKKEKKRKNNTKAKNKIKIQRNEKIIPSNEENIAAHKFPSCVISGSALHFAVRNQEIETVKQLLENGASVNSEDLMIFPLSRN